MNSRERVLAALRREQPDRVPWVEGGIMISSANSITFYCKVENVWAMAEAIRKYGTYLPLSQGTPR